jgi:hypothetical protein
LEDNHRTNLACKLKEEHHDDLHDVCKRKEGIPWLLYTQLSGSACVADEENEKEVEADIPIEVLEVGWVLQEELTDERARVLDERVDGHNVEEREVSRQPSSTLLYQLHHRTDICHLRSEWRRN